MSEAPHVVAQDLRFAHTAPDGPAAILDGVGLDVAPGQFVALVGPSGCGKSTLLDVLAGLRAPDRGRVQIDGQNVAAGDLALMPQTDALFPWRTLLDNVAMGARLAGADATSAAVASHEVLARVGLSGFERHFPHALSGGMRQRAALARTLVSGRRGWLLDEPFGALDALTRADLRADLHETWARLRPTVILVTHDIEEAAVLADRVIVCGRRPMGVTREIEMVAPHPRSVADVAEARAEITEVLGQLSTRAVAG